MDSTIGSVRKGILKRAIEDAGYRPKYVATARLPSNGKFCLYENKTGDRFLLFEEDATKMDIFVSVSDDIEDKIMTLYNKIKQEKKK